MKLNHPFIIVLVVLILAAASLNYSVGQTEQVDSLMEHAGNAINLLLEEIRILHGTGTTMSW